jgi:hypothetical protein
MAAVINKGWCKPSTILFASEIPANERAFAFALAQATEFGADLILFHVHFPSPLKPWSCSGS